MPSLYKETLGPLDFYKPHHIRIRFARSWDGERLNLARQILNSDLSDEDKLRRLAGMFGPLAHDVEISTVTEIEHALS